ncbi:uncharacterized protein NEMAJ01_1916 [Nematocida major]|uniref:uncharacterized protein n=1 Tax=Nematocida major TaxID=1912982 RepID=UPI00200893EB|nr:uncharacterized protein NEMAJ01_1916 [Nematocida major]KAH9387020.1 hypothetical protein NEMAJ01_1916 [Nematocida major]
MNIECRILSYSTDDLIPTENGVWWWEGAPVFTKDHSVRVWLNGQRICFDCSTGSFTLALSTLHDIKMGILEIFLEEKGILQNELIGYVFKRVEDLLQERKDSVHYLKILPNNDPINGWLYSKKAQPREFIPKEMGFFLAVSVKIKASTDPPSTKANGISFLWARFLKNEAIAGRIFDLQEAFFFLFRDLQNISEFVYSIRELFAYYAYRDSLEFREIPKYPGKAEKPRFWERIFRLFKPKSVSVRRRIDYSLYLKEVLSGENPYKWHVEERLFYTQHLKNYRYAIAPYGHAFLNLHSLLNVIKNKLEECRCMHCENPGVDSEEKFFHRFTGIPYGDIVHAASKYLEHVIFIDREESTLYITFKGTLHKREALIDIDYKYHKYKGNLFHRGIFKESEKFIKEKEKVLDQLMINNNLKKIRLVGQSLGGALSILVWMFMRESETLSKYSVSSIAYSPPPVVSNPSWFRRLEGEKSEGNKITVLIYGNDIIPMLSMGAVFELRLLATHFYAISVSKYRNKHRYIHAVLRKMKKHGIAKLFIPGEIYKIRHTTTTPSTFLVKKTHWTEYSAIKLWAKAFMHHTPGAMINALNKSLKYFYSQEDPTMEISSSQEEQE